MTERVKNSNYEKIHYVYRPEGGVNADHKEPAT